ncbi:hypothetical protein EDD85DRAFT_947787 [Armillaria nabsnona]|nr:hypothetical protein EDD85DRAFT_947787 [Armillaria nabsnona]
MVLIAPLLCPLLKETVSVAFERRENIRLGGRKGRSWLKATTVAIRWRRKPYTQSTPLRMVMILLVKVVATVYEAFIALDSGSGGDVLPGVIEAQEKSSSPLESRRMVLGGNGADPATTTGFVMVSTEAVASSKGPDKVVAALEALKKSGLAVVVEIGGNPEIGGNGDQTTSLVTVELVLVESPSAPAEVDTAAKEQGVEEKSRSGIRATVIHAALVQPAAVFDDPEFAGLLMVLDALAWVAVAEMLVLVSAELEDDIDATLAKGQRCARRRQGAEALGKGLRCRKRVWA